MSSASVTNISEKRSEGLPPPYEEVVSGTEKNSTNIGTVEYQSLVPSAPPPESNSFHGQAARDNSSTDTFAESVKIKTKSILSLANDAKKEDVTETLFLDFMQIHAQHLTATSLFGKIKLVVFIGKLGTNSDAHLAKISKDAGVLSIEKCNAVNCMDALKSAFKIWKSDENLGLRDLNIAIGELPRAYFDKTHYLLTPLIKAADAITAGIEQVQALQHQHQQTLQAFHQNIAELNDSNSRMKKELEQTKTKRDEWRDSYNEINNSSCRILQKQLEAEEALADNAEKYEAQISILKAENERLKEGISPSAVPLTDHKPAIIPNGSGRTEEDVQFLNTTIRQRDKLAFYEWSYEWMKIAEALGVENSRIKIVDTSSHSVDNKFGEIIEIQINAVGLTPNSLIDAISTAIRCESQVIETKILKHRYAKAERLGRLMNLSK